MLFGPQETINDTLVRPPSLNSAGINTTTTTNTNTSSPTLSINGNNGVHTTTTNRRKTNADGKKRRTKTRSSPPRDPLDPHSALATPSSSAPTKFKKTKSKKKLVDRTCMYVGVWKQLGFKNKNVKFNGANSSKPVCVTGIDGFVAAWIVHELLERGYKVKGTVQSRNDDISGIFKLPLAESNLTIVETSLLTPESCDIAVEGCDFVIHTGTPTSCSVRDLLSEQQEPGVHSIGSRMHCIIPMMTNFIQACARARVKRVVLTSSVAAMTDSVQPSSIINDTCWNVASSLERNPHFLSLKLAEEAAWQLVDQLPQDTKIDLITVNPGALIGPSICNAQIPAGNQVIYDLITGQYSALVDLNWAMTDVRDCAKAHVLAMLTPEARGRFICVNKTIWLKDIVDILSNNGYSGRDLPWKVGLPNWVARLPSYSTQLGQVGASLYAFDPFRSRSCPYLSDKIVEILDLKFTNAQATIIDAAGDLLKWGLIKPWAEDHEAIHCACCHLPFSFYRRKHHCRECGVIICADCSMSRAVVDGLEDKARLCDICVQTSIPALLDLLHSPQPDSRRKAVIALESLMETMSNHEYLTRGVGIPQLINLLHVADESIALHAAGTLYVLSHNVSSSLQMVLEGAVLQMLEVEETSGTWRMALQALRNIWKQINRVEFRRMLHAVARVSSDSTIGALKGNILLTFVHMMEPREVVSLLAEGLMEVFYTMLQAEDEYPRCAAAHAIKHLIPPDYNPTIVVQVPPYIVDDHEELLTNAALSDLQFLVKGHIAPINAHKVVLFFRNSYFKNMFGSATSQKSMIEVDNCSYEVFSMLLRFLYTGKVRIECDTAEDLLRASSFYQVFELQKRTEKFLANEIRISNVVDLLYLSDQCHAEDLKDICIPFLLKNIHAVVRLESFRNHRQWASREVLSALSNVLGKEWKESYIQVINKANSSHTTTTMTTMAKMTNGINNNNNSGGGGSSSGGTSGSVLPDEEVVSHTNGGGVVYISPISSSGTTITTGSSSSTSTNRGIKLQNMNSTACGVNGNGSTNLNDMSNYTGGGSYTKQCEAALLDDDDDDNKDGVEYNNGMIDYNNTTMGNVMSPKILTSSVISERSHLFSDDLSEGVC